MEILQHKTMTLGDVIKALDRLDPEAEMKVPMGFGSWRGVYAELTLHADFAPDEIGTQTVGDLLVLAREAVGKEYTGYKGGEFVMRESTQVWADGWGQCVGYRPVGFVDRDGYVDVQVIEVDPY